MNIQEILQTTASILLSLGGATVIIFALSKWLGEIWSARIIENDKSVLLREHELLIRRRNVYTKLVTTMRVFLASDMPPTRDQKDAFLSAYDEAALWASEGVVEQLSILIELMHIKPDPNPETKSQKDLKSTFIDCIKAMRQDCGFPRSNYQHQIIRF